MRKKILSLIIILTIVSLFSGSVIAGCPIVATETITPTVKLTKDITGIRLTLADGTVLLNTSSYISSNTYGDLRDLNLVILIDTSNPQFVNDIRGQLTTAVNDVFKLYREGPYARAAANCEIGVIGFDDSLSGGQQNITKNTTANAVINSINTVSGGRSLEQALLSAKDNFSAPDDNRIQSVIIVSDGFYPVVNGYYETEEERQELERIYNLEQNAMLGRGRDILVDLQDNKSVIIMSAPSMFNKRELLYGSHVFPWDIGGNSPDMSHILWRIQTFTIIQFVDENPIDLSSAGVQIMPDGEYHVILDNELMYGASLEIEYTIRLTSTRTSAVSKVRR